MSGEVAFSPTDSYQEIENKTKLLWTREEDYKNGVKKVIKSSTKYITNNQDLSATEVFLGEELKEIIALSQSKEKSVLALSSIFKSIGKLRSKMANQVEIDFVKPLGEFVDFQFGSANYARSQVKKSVREYQSQLEQFEKAIKDGKIDSTRIISFEKELQQIKSTVNSNAMDFGNVMQDLQEKKTLVIVKQIIKCLQVHHQFYKKISSLFNDIIPKLKSLYQELEQTISPKKRISKEGYLHVKRGKNNWNREYFEIRNEKLLNYKLDRGLRYSGFAPEKTLELNLCSLKPGCPDKLKERLKDDSKKCFQIFSPMRKPLVFMASSKVDAQAWENTILSAISLSLDNSKSSGAPVQNTKVVKLLRGVAGNSTCVDCDAEDPVWASINLGVLMCLECSGVHRYLGVHITKVRSLTLDLWDPEQLMYMLKIGNERANMFFECRVPDSHPKPTASSPRADRERYIIAKYKEKLFLPPTTSSFNINQELMNMVQEPQSCDLLKMLLLLFAGGDVNYAEEGKTLLSYAAENDNWLYAHMLALSGAELFTADTTHSNTAYHYAAENNAYHALLVLVRNGKDKDFGAMKNSQGESPLDIATHHQYVESQALLLNNLTWTIPIDRILELTDEVGGEVVEPFPILDPSLLVDHNNSNTSNNNSNNNNNTSPSHSSSLPSSSSALHHDAILSSSGGDTLNTSNDQLDDAKEIINKTAWKRGIDTTDNKKGNRISVLVSQMITNPATKRGSVNDAQKASSLDTSGGGSGGGGGERSGSTTFTNNNNNATLNSGGGGGGVGSVGSVGSLSPHHATSTTTTTTTTTSSTSTSSTFKDSKDSKIINLNFGRKREKKKPHLPHHSTISPSVPPIIPTFRKVDNPFGEKESKEIAALLSPRSASSSSPVDDNCGAKKVVSASTHPQRESNSTIELKSIMNYNVFSVGSGGGGGGGNNNAASSSSSSSSKIKNNQQNNAESGHEEDDGTDDEYDYEYDFESDATPYHVDPSSIQFTEDDIESALNWDVGASDI